MTKPARGRADQASSEVHERTQLAIQAGGVGIWELDFNDGRFIWDDRMHELYGLPPETFSGSLDEWETFLFDEDRRRVLDEWTAAVEGPGGFDTEFRIQWSSGELRHIRALAHVVRRSDGTPLRAVGTNWDITCHKRLTEQLFEEKERLRTTLYSIGDAVICTDAEARITFMNPVAERMTGWLSTDAVSRFAREVFLLVDDEENNACVSDPVTACLRGGAPTHLDEGCVLLSRTGERRSVRESVAPVKTKDGEMLGAVLVFQDVTRSRTLQKQLAHSASHDLVTGLANRLAFDRRLQQAARDAREQNRQHALCFLDLDRFKIVNDTAGHAAGDALLRTVGALIRQGHRSHDCTARLGGDEFALLLQDCSIEDALAIAGTLLDEIRTLRFQWDDKVYDIGASIGIAPITSASPRAADLMSQADIACYAAKAAGRNRVSVYDGASSRRPHELAIASSIRRAIESNRFQLFAQELRPLQPGLGDGRHVELLLRMEDESGHLLEPDAFAPAAERYDLMGALDRWVIRTAFREYGARLRGPGLASVSINLSSHVLEDPQLWAYLQEELRASALPAGRLQVEIGEMAVMNNPPAASQFAALAQRVGIGLTVGNVGVGLSPLATLKQLPISRVKIHGSLVRGITRSGVERTIVQAIHAIGRELGARTVAAQVEDDETLALVQQVGIDYAQGDAIADARPIDSLLSLVAPYH